MTEPDFLRALPGLTVWFTGLSGAGKSTLARAVAGELRQKAIPTQILDADRIRLELCRDLGYTSEDRIESVRRIAVLARLFAEQPLVTLVAAIAPFRSMRNCFAGTDQRCLEVSVDAPLSACERRDPAGIYRRFRAGALSDIAGIDLPFEAPASPDVHCRTDLQSLEACTHQTVAVIESVWAGHHMNRSKLG